MTIACDRLREPVSGKLAHQHHMVYSFAREKAFFVPGEILP